MVTLSLRGRQRNHHLCLLGEGRPDALGRDAHVHIGVRLGLRELDEAAALEREQLREPPEAGSNSEL